MPISCPQCASVSALSESEIGPNGCMVRCERCGTTWLARPFEENPYRRMQLQLQPVVPDVSDAVVIEHIAGDYADRDSGFRRNDEQTTRFGGRESRYTEGEGKRTLPPHRREAASPRQTTSKTLGGHRSLKTFAGVLGAIALLMVLRAPIVSAFPELGGTTPEMRALEFQQVRSETVDMQGARTLYVEGNVVNHSGDTVGLPAIRITLRSTGGDAVASWVVEPSATAVEAGKTVGFRSALASPPADATQVTLNLTERKAQVIGLR
jgi:predicted Zn finger-like uncharacterized protein